MPRNFPHRTLEVALLAAAVAAPLAPPVAGAVLLAGVALAWLASRPPRREVAIAGVALLLAAGALTVRAGLDGRLDPATEAGRRRIAAAYGELWQGLDAAAERAAEAFPRAAAGGAYGGADAFRALAELTARPGESGPALLLVNPDGEAVAWGGPGLLHELRPADLPVAGAAFEASFGAVTLLAARPLEEGRRPWRVVAAQSFPSDRLPFGGRWPYHRPALRWSLVEEPAAGAGDAVALPLADRPALVVAPGSGPAGGESRPLAAAAWAAIGFALLALAVMRGVGMALPAAAAGRRPLPPAVAALALAGALAWGLAVGSPAGALGALVVGGGVAAIAVLRRRAGGGPGAAGNPARRRAAVYGGLAALALTAAAWGVQWLTGPLDLAGDLAGPVPVLPARLAAAAAAFGLLALAGGRAGGITGRSGESEAWAAFALALVAAAGHDLPWLALPLLALAGAAAAAWLAAAGGLRGPAAVAALVTLAALLSATAWETAYRVRLRGELGGPLLARMEPPGGGELTALEGRISAYFADQDLAAVLPRAPGGLERQDLGFVLWQASPLARPNALSAVVVEPLVGPPSTFAFGLTLDDDRELDLGAERWAELREYTSAGRPAAGEAELTYLGEPWAVVRWWLLPGPGFGLDAAADLGEVETGLLRGGPAAEAHVRGLPGPALFAVYAPGGGALLSPWRETPPLPAGLAPPGGGRALVETPDGLAWGFARSAADGREVIYLPLLTPLSALERVATSAVGTLMLAAIATLLALLLALPRAAFRDLLRQAVRSYSKRLLVVYTLLLLLPLLLLNAVLMRAVEERLEREQRLAGEAALEAAQRQAAESLEEQPPGFAIATSLDDERLNRISRLVHHEVNLYWRSSIYASSKAELFAAGLLPKRIPGDIYARLAFLGFELASRTNRAGGTSYVELYTPLRVPGEPSGTGSLVLSMPLLAQQQAVAEELAGLRRQALLVTAALFALLTAVGARLARNFTRPLMEVVRGTRRIADGATSLDLAPRDVELEALVGAVDEMARRIAEGRDKLLREKQVVDRMVASITSGVVSLDADRRVLMHNRVAAELLGVAVGEPLDRALAASERLAPVGELLAAAGGEPLRRTVRLPGDDGDEREWSVAWVPVPGPGEPTALLVVEDATETLRGQRLQAWAEMARIIAHEIKNPLTPLRLNIEHMRQVRADGGERFGEIFERCTVNALAQVEELRQIASEFSTYSSIPRIDPQPGDLAAAMRQLAEPYRAAPPAGVEVALELPPGGLTARFDNKLLGRAVRNLLENALRASSGGGRVLLSVGEVAVGNTRAARVAVADGGPGVAPELLPRIFDPYFSTHDSGTGLGLPIARQIAEEHGGAIGARNRPGGGLEVAITIPLQ